MQVREGKVSPHVSKGHPLFPHSVTKASNETCSSYSHGQIHTTSRYTLRQIVTGCYSLRGLSLRHIVTSLYSLRRLSLRQTVDSLYSLRGMSLRQIVTSLYSLRSLSLRQIVASLYSLRGLSLRQIVTKSQIRKARQKLIVPKSVPNFTP